MKKLFSTAAIIAALASPCLLRHSVRVWVRLRTPTPARARSADQSPSEASDAAATVKGRHCQPCLTYVFACPAGYPDEVEQLILGDVVALHHETDHGVE
jgi:hypothetical protein